MTRIFVTREFSALHAWPDAPPVVGFLQNPHRHLFKIRAEIEVMHDDRDIEFFMVQGVVDEWVESLPVDLGAMSCEMLAGALVEHLSDQYGEHRWLQVEVSEDGENGGIVERQP